MSESTTRKDIDEVIDIMKDFMSQVSGQFSEVNKRLDRLELAARDSQFEKLLAWARKVSEKTGIPLENV